MKILSVDLNDLRQLIESEGGKIIVVESGKPTLVVASFEEYKKRTNQTPELFQNQGRQTEELPRELEEDPLKIEDLPV